MPPPLRAVLAAGAVTALAGGPLHAQEARWAVVAEGGVSHIHGSGEFPGVAAALRLQRRMPGFAWARAELAVTAGGSDEGFQTMEAGLELRLCSTCRLTGFIGGGGGFLHEPVWSGGVLRANAGLELRISRRLALRAGGQVGTHGGVRGPQLATLGVSYRFE